MSEFEKAIKEYLDGFAEQDPIFKKKYESSANGVDKCCNYIISEVQKMGKTALTDDEVFGIAVHFYDESLSAPASVAQCKVVVSRPRKKASPKRGERQEDEFVQGLLF